MNQLITALNNLDLHRIFTQDDILSMDEYPEFKFDITYNNIFFEATVINHVDSIDFRFISNEMWKSKDFSIQSKGKVHWHNGSGALNNSAEFSETLERTLALNLLENDIIGYLIAIDKDEKLYDVVTKNKKTYFESLRIQNEIDAKQKSEDIEKRKKEFEDKYKFIFGESMQEQAKNAKQSLREIKNGKPGNKKLFRTINSEFDFVESKIITITYSEYEEFNIQISDSNGNQKGRIQNVRTQRDAAKYIARAYEKKD